MDIELFNKQLAIKVAKATNLEKRGEIKNAIDAWLEVSEMSLKFSKTRGIDSTFRNMLIKRTEKIVDHIKSLKLNLAEPERIVKSDLFNDREFLSQDFDDTIEDTEIPDNLKKESANTNDDLKTIPGGFVEIKAPKDFEIITPHEELDMDIFKENRTVILSDEEKSSVEKDNGTEQNRDKKLICFACGYDDNPPNAKTCKNCNVELK